MLKGLSFALIEDNKEFGNLVSVILDEAQITRYKEVSAFVDKNYDVVFCDLRLKETWGKDTIVALRAKTKAPIVVLTALGGLYLAASDLKELLDAGADEVYNKEIVNDHTFPQQILDVIGKTNDKPENSSER